MGLTVDVPIPSEVLRQIERAIGAERARFLVLPS
jgi:hypothetical protein